MESKREFVYSVQEAADNVKPLTNSDSHVTRARLYANGKVAGWIELFYYKTRLNAKTQVTAKTNLTLLDGSTASARFTYALASAVNNRAIELGPTPGPPTLLTSRAVSHSGLSDKQPTVHLKPMKTTETGVVVTTSLDEVFPWNGRHLELNKNHTIPEHTTYRHYRHVHVPEGVTLTARGGLISKSISVAGTLVVHGSHAHKSLTVLKTGRYEVRGASRSNKVRAVINDDTINSTTVTNNGVFIVEKGATYTNNSTFTNKSQMYVYGIYVNNATTTSSVYLNITGKFNNYGTYTNSGNTDMGGVYRNLAATTNLKNFAVNGTLYNDVSGNYVNGNNKTGVLLVVNGTFQNAGVYTNIFNASFFLSKSGKVYNEATFTNYSNLVYIYGTLQNGTASSPGTITSNQGCVMTIYGSVSPADTYTGNLNTTYGTVAQYTDGILLEGGVTTTPANITTTAISDYKLQHVDESLTHSEHNIPLKGGIMNADDSLYTNGINSSFISKIRLYSPDGTELGSVSKATKDFISNTNALQSNISVRIPHEWFSSLLVQGDAYRVSFKVKDGMDHDLEEEVTYTVETWYPFLYLPS